MWSCERLLELGRLILPLVNIVSEPKFLTGRSSVAYQLGAALPALFVANEQRLRLDPGTPEVAVQVMFAKYGELDINTAEVWVLITFTEDGLTEDQQEDVRQVLRELLYGALAGIVEQRAKLHLAARSDELGLGATENQIPKLVVDSFWGDGHGFMLDRLGNVTLEW